MKRGDKVRKVKGNPFGKIGTIRSITPAVRPTNLMQNPRGLKEKPEQCFFCRAEDGTFFSGFEDELELVR